MDSIYLREVLEKAGWSNPIINNTFSQGGTARSRSVATLLIHVINWDLFYVPLEEPDSFGITTIYGNQVEKYNVNPAKSLLDYSWSPGLYTFNPCVNKRIGVSFDSNEYIGKANFYDADSLGNYQDLFSIWVSPNGMKTLIKPDKSEIVSINHTIVIPSLSRDYEAIWRE